MKKLFKTMAGCLLVLLGQTLPANAQNYFPPSTQDYDAETSAARTPQNGVAHTGTDVLKIDQNTWLQAMVWDNSQGEVTLSTVINPAYVTGGGTNKFAFTLALPNPYTSLSDPDVAMAFYNGNLYADVVYLASYTDALGVHTRTFYDVYPWDAGAQQFDNTPGYFRQALGVASVANLPGFPGGAAIPRRHSSPNIDANADGRVGIVWQETSTETAQITVLSPSYSSTSIPAYPGGYTYLMEGLTFAESYVVPANADGTPYVTCTLGWRGDLISKTKAYTSTPTPTNNNPPILYNQTIKPDVAVGADGRWWVSYLVSAATQGEPVLGEPQVTAGINLVLRQVTFDCISGSIQVQSTFLSQVWTKGVTLASPRVATSPDPDHADDVEVVQAWSGTPCQDGFGPRAYYEIRNWGRSNSDFRTDYNVVSQASIFGQNGYPAYDPVVAFYGIEQPGNYRGDYLVDWTGVDYPTDSQQQDVWSASLNAGNLQYDYSRVNMDNPEGHQHTPSVAARFSAENSSSAHFFADENVSHDGYSGSNVTVRYRYTTIPTGSGNLNRPGAGGSSSAHKARVPRALEAFPNPFSNSVDFRVSLHQGEVVQSIQVTDLSGRVLDKVPVSATSTGETAAPAVFTWRPGRPLQTGSYLVRLTTNQRTETLPLSKQ